MDIITRQEAKEQGLKTYYDGKPCKHGHTSVRYTTGQQCIACCLVRSEKRWNTQKDAVKATMRKYRERLKRDVPLTVHLTVIKHRAKKKGIEFTITEDDIHIPTHCPILGIELRRSPRGFADASPALDRIYNTKGYVPGNVHVISTRANRLKSDASIEELRAIVDYLDRLTSG